MLCYIYSISYKVICIHVLLSENSIHIIQEVSFRKGTTIQDNQIL